VPFPNKPIVVLPERAASRDVVLRVLEELNAPAVGLPVPPDAELAVVDLTVDGGEAALESLLKSPAGLKLSVVAVAEGAVAEREIAGVADVLHPKNLDAELGLRLRRARARQLTYREARARQHDLQVLLELTARYAEATDVDELLHEVTRRLAEEMEIDRAALVLLDGEKSFGTILAASDDPSLKDLKIDLKQYPEIREVVRTGKPVIVEDAPSHPLLEGVKEKVLARGIRNIAAMPLAIGSKVLGVLLLRRSSGRGAFVNREVDFLTTVGHATAVALRNARQLDAERLRREKEKNARLAAEARAEAMRQYESYFQHLSDGVAILDEKACVLSLNPAGCKLLDVAVHEAKGRHINALTNPSDDGLVMELLSSVSSGQTRTDVDVPVRTLAGRKLVLSVSAAPLDLERDKAVAILTLRDVTRARALAEELQKTKDYLERLIDSSVDAIIAADMRGKITLFNKAAESVCGWTNEEALSMLDVGKLYPDGQAREVMASLRSKEHGGVGRLTQSRREIVHKSGERIPVSMSAAIIYEAGREIGTVGIFTDLRDRLKLERKLSDAQERLEESEKNKVLMALAGAAAHELNQPLTSVMGYAELVKRKIPETEPSFRYIDVIYREAERMAEIVRKIGKITRYEVKEYVGDQTIVDIDRAAAHPEDDSDATAHDVDAFRAFFDAADGPAALCDSQMRVLSANPAFEALCGPRRILGRPLSESVSPVPKIPPDGSEETVQVRFDGGQSVALTFSRRGATVAVLAHKFGSAA
jgi:PAS domain S-box-containing protein